MARNKYSKMRCLVTVFLGLASWFLPTVSAASLPIAAKPTTSGRFMLPAGAVATDDEGIVLHDPPLHSDAVLAQQEQPGFLEERNDGATSSASRQSSPPFEKQTSPGAQSTAYDTCADTCRSSASAPASPPSSSRPSTTSSAAGGSSPFSPADSMPSTSEIAPLTGISLVTIGGDKILENLTIRLDRVFSKDYQSRRGRSSRGSFFFGGSGAEEIESHDVYSGPSRDVVQGLLDTSRAGTTADHGPHAASNCYNAFVQFLNQEIYFSKAEFLENKTKNSNLPGEKNGAANKKNKHKGQSAPTTVTIELDSLLDPVYDVILTPGGVNLAKLWSDHAMIPEDADPRLLFHLDEFLFRTGPKGRGGMPVLSDNSALTLIRKPKTLQNLLTSDYMNGRNGPLYLLKKQLYYSEFLKIPSEAEPVQEIDAVRDPEMRATAKLVGLKMLDVLVKQEIVEELKRTTRTSGAAAARTGTSSGSSSSSLMSPAPQEEQPAPSPPVALLDPLPQTEGLKLDILRSARIEQPFSRPHATLLDPVTDFEEMLQRNVIVKKNAENLALQPELVDSTVERPRCWTRNCFQLVMNDYRGDEQDGGQLHEDLHLHGNDYHDHDDIVDHDGNETQFPAEHQGAEIIAQHSEDVADQPMDALPGIVREDAERPDAAQQEAGAVPGDPTLHLQLHHQIAAVPYPAVYRPVAVARQHPAALNGDVLEAQDVVMQQGDDLDPHPAQEVQMEVVELQQEEQHDPDVQRPQPEQQVFLQHHQIHEQEWHYDARREEAQSVLAVDFAALELELAAHEINRKKSLASHRFTAETLLRLLDAQQEATCGIRCLNHVASGSTTTSGTTTKLVHTYRANKPEEQGPVSTDGAVAGATTGAPRLQLLVKKAPSDQDDPEIAGSNAKPSSSSASSGRAAVLPRHLREDYHIEIFTKRSDLNEDQPYVWLSVAFYPARQRPRRHQGASTTSSKFRSTTIGEDEDDVGISELVHQDEQLPPTGANLLEEEKRRKLLQRVDLRFELETSVGGEASSNNPPQPNFYYEMYNYDFDDDGYYQEHLVQQNNGQHMQHNTFGHMQFKKPLNRPPYGLRGVVQSEEHTGIVTMVRNTKSEDVLLRDVSVFFSAVVLNNNWVPKHVTLDREWHLFYEHQIGAEKQDSDSEDAEDDSLLDWVGTGGNCSSHGASTSHMQGHLLEVAPPRPGSGVNSTGGLFLAPSSSSTHGVVDMITEQVELDEKAISAKKNFSPQVHARCVAAHMRAVTLPPPDAALRVGGAGRDVGHRFLVPGPGTMRAGDIAVYW
ncbi:unnamed protein product [Amoebophrya sp. A120]|nr:unnamed protein product [Amoebophrya sp. A120]|eukprot:GSA120T00015800001.1